MPKRPTIADRADRHHLYQRAVQCVEAEIDFVDETFTQLRGRKASLLREDFCGTLNTSCEWVRRRAGNVAVGVDLDPDPLEWGRANNIARLSKAQRARIHAHRGDVLDPVPRALAPRGFDTILAMNFSFWCFKARGLMLEYFRACRRSLAADGILFTDFCGGSDSMKVMRERRPVARETEDPVKGRYNGPFTYIWDQAEYNPITGDLACHIHFRFPDGSSIRPAFSYRWRLWTLPEVREIMMEAGFRKTTVYWEGDDGEGGGDGVFIASERGDAGESFICYLTAEK